MGLPQALVLLVLVATATVGWPDQGREVLMLLRLLLLLLLPSVSADSTATTASCSVNLELSTSAMQGEEGYGAAVRWLSLGSSRIPWVHGERGAGVVACCLLRLSTVKER